MISELQNNSSQESSSRNGLRQGKWSKKEHIRFLKALKIFNNDWRKISSIVETRTPSQVRSHAQKYFNKKQSDEEKIGKNKKLIIGDQKDPTKTRSKRKGLIEVKRYQQIIQDQSVQQIQQPESKKINSQKIKKIQKNNKAGISKRKIKIQSTDFNQIRQFSEQEQEIFSVNQLLQQFESLNFPYQPIKENSQIIQQFSPQKEILIPVFTRVYRKDRNSFQYQSKPEDNQSFFMGNIISRLNQEGYQFCLLKDYKFHKLVSHANIRNTDQQIEMM